MTYVCLKFGKCATVGNPFSSKVGLKSRSSLSAKMSSPLIGSSSSLASKLHEVKCDIKSVMSVKGLLHTGQCLEEVFSLVWGALEDGVGMVAFWADPGFWDDFLVRLAISSLFTDSKILAMAAPPLNFFDTFLSESCGPNELGKKFWEKT